MPKVRIGERSVKICKMSKNLVLVLLFISGLRPAFAQNAVREIPRDTTFSIARVYRQVKKDYPYARPVKDSLPAGVKAYRDLVYATLPDTPFGRRDLHVDLFRPEKAGKYPALVMVHGGGWRAGEKSMEVPMAQVIAARGFVTVAVEYQLSLEAKYPAAVYNIKSAIRWLRANA